MFVNIGKCKKKKKDFTENSAVGLFVGLKIKFRLFVLVDFL